MPQGILSFSRDWSRQVTHERLKGVVHNSCTCFLRALHRRREEAHRYARPCARVTLHQLSLVDLSDPPLQLLRMLREELEFGAVALWVLPWVVVPNFGWENAEQDIFNFQEESYTNVSKVWCKPVRVWEVTRFVGSEKNAETMELNNQFNNSYASYCVYILLC